MKFGSTNDKQYEMRELPHNSEAEQSVLSSLIMENALLDDVLNVLKSKDLYHKPHQIVFDSILDLSAKGHPFDLVSVVTHLSKSGHIEAAGGKEYLVSLLKNTPGVSNCLYYTSLVKEKSVLRDFIKVAEKLTEVCHFPQGKSLDDIVDVAESSIMSVTESSRHGINDFHSVDSLLQEAIDRIDEAFNNDSSITGMQTHFTELDEITAGLQNSDLIIVAGRPAMGKTSFSLNLAENVILKEGVNAGVFTLEMPAIQLIMRIISSIGRIASEKLKKGTLEPDDWTKLNKAIIALNDQGLLIDETPALSISELKSRARKMDKIFRKNEVIKQNEALRDEAEKTGNDPSAITLVKESDVKGLGILVIDYIQLMRGSKPGLNREQEIGEISRGLKELAKELNIPVIALAQLNRSLEQRVDKRPKLSDLRESGSIEQDADMILFVYRDEIYNPDSADKGLAEIIFGKHRAGSLGTVQTVFLGEFTRFENYDRFHEQPETY